MTITAPGSGPRTRLLDAVAVAWAVGIGVFVDAARLPGSAWGAHPLVRDLRLPDLVLGAACCAAVCWRRTRPVGLALVTAVLAVLFPSVSGAGLVAVFTVAVHRRWPTTALVAAAQTAALAPAYLLYPYRPPPAWVVLLAIALAVGWGLFLRAQHQLVQSLHDSAARSEAEHRARLLRTRRAERDRIAREMHDVLAHRLSLLAVHAGALEFHPNAAPEEIARAAGVVRGTAHQALTDLRDVIGVLRDDLADEPPALPQPTLCDLPALIADNRQAGLPVTFQDRMGRPEDVPTGVGRAVYRILQEALTNARKHSPAGQVTATLSGSPHTGVTIEVCNALATARPEPRIPGTGSGLVGLQERVHLAGGRLQHGPTATGGYRLWAWLPWTR